VFESVSFGTFFADVWFNKTLQQIASRIWPMTDPGDPEDSNEEGLSIEDQIAKEISSLRCPQTERLFGKHFPFTD